ncbi:coniferyl aldehyde dehydrogenase [Pinirhizobacter soli]|uniref:coniferyl aldehyde dehydrogenase n=1 Tax=Pinirhizobacter soli TaxID=2786953 RepID=UPI00202A5EDA|nr:coniferyl aldehyde dehydrogenase [Pinirhizobacter soli]
MQKILDAMRAAHRQEPPADGATRRDRLDRLAALVRDNGEAIATAISADFGQRSSEETSLLEVFPSLGGIKHARKHVRRWMRVRRHWAGFWFLPARVALQPQALGVVGIIVPWNYPLYLAVGPITDALAAGNRVIVKMSELTPAFSALFADLVARYFRADEVSVVNGDADVAAAFSALPFDHLLFTGSTAVGRHVMRAASANLTPVTLELGGKSPAIVAPGARMDHAVERIVFGKLVNAGQTCIAPDYVLLPRDQVDDFVARVGKRVEAFYPSIGENNQYSSIVNDRHFDRLRGWREDAVAAGAKAHVLGNEEGTRRLAPSLLTNVTDEMTVMREEIFGPLLPIVPYDRIEDAINFVNDRPHPLSLYLFTDDRRIIDDVLARTRAGGVTINDTLFHIAQHNLPFGGVGPSGMGAYHGKTGFDTFSRLKPILRQARLNGVGLLNPPYGTRFRRMLSIMLGR